MNGIKKTMSRLTDSQSQDPSLVSYKSLRPNLQGQKVIDS